MLNNENKLLQSMPEGLDSAVESIDFAYANLDRLMHADVSRFEDQDYSIFAYASRDSVFYVNKAGRGRLEMTLPTFEPRYSRTAPIFWLDNGVRQLADDRDVVQRGSPKHGTAELITFAWGKSWMKGSKFPIRSTLGVPIAILFIGHEIAGSEQIRKAAKRLHWLNNEFGQN